MLTIQNPSTFDWANMSLVDCAEGNAADAYFTLKIFDLIEEKLASLGMSDLLEKLIMPSLTLFSEMEYEGLDVDTSKLDSVGNTLRETNMNLEDSLYVFDQVKKTHNLSSNNDLIDILYLGEDGFDTYPPDLTAKGAPSVSAPTLKLLLEQIEKELESRG